LQAVVPAADADAAAMIAAAAADAADVTKLPRKSIETNTRADSLLSFGPCSLSGKPWGIAGFLPAK
jgi:hypothetical protein